MPKKVALFVDVESLHQHLRTAHNRSLDPALVRAHLRRGAQGEARAAYRRYVARMEEIDVEAVPFPSAPR